MASFDQVLVAWDNYGVFEYLLPFLVVFTITYALLQKVQLFGQAGKKINVVLALSFGLLFLQNVYLRTLFQRFIPNVSFILIACLMFLLLLGIFGGSHSAWRGFALFLALIFSIISIIIAVSNDYLGEGYSSLYEWWFALDTVARSTIIFVIIILIVVGYAIKDDSNQQGGLMNGIRSFMREIEGGQGGRP